MSSTSRPPEIIEFEARLPPDADTQPVEPPPEPPGKDEWLRPSNKIPSVGGFDELTKTGVVKGWALDPDLPSGRCLVYFDGRSHTLYVYAIDYSGLRRDSPLIGTRSFLLQPENEAPVGVLET
jgi:hypothetical protein